MWTFIGGIVVGVIISVVMVWIFIHGIHIN